MTYETRTIRDAVDHGAAWSPWWTAFDHDEDAGTLTVAADAFGPRFVTDADIDRARRALLARYPASAVARDERNGNADAASADAVLQLAAFGEIYFG